MHSAAALEPAHGKILDAGGAADLLGVTPHTLAARMRSPGIERKRSASSRCRSQYSRLNTARHCGTIETP